ncbi:hypothetical protein AMECASPLE_003152 [Ameca splendens]|uniref:Uncharacterized protein n=1 Tax=Ameca splendens TaxID=208324 RepID=A0ABV0YX11_9TELE
MKRLGLLMLQCEGADLPCYPYSLTLVHSNNSSLNALFTDLSLDFTEGNVYCECTLLSKHFLPPLLKCKILCIPAQITEAAFLHLNPTAADARCHSTIFMVVFFSTQASLFPSRPPP